MNTQWFAGVNTVEEIKKLYKSLAFQHHPDRGGNTATMQEINAQYTQALKACNGQKSTSDNGEHTYRYDEQKESEIINKINETLNSGITRQGVDLYLIGTWLWAQGDTKPSKEQLKAMGYKWHSKRSCWYWHNDGYRHTYASNADFGSLAAKYGATNFKSKVENEVAA